MYPKVYNSTQYARVNVVAIQDYQFQPSLQGSSAYQRLLDEIREGVHCLPDDHLREAKLSNRLESPDADPQRDPSD